MIIPSALFTGNKTKDFETMGDMNVITNIIWQSERKTFQDCELIMEQIILDLFKKGYLRRPE